MEIKVVHTIELSEGTKQFLSGIFNERLTGSSINIQPKDIVSAVSGVSKHVPNSDVEIKIEEVADVNESVKEEQVASVPLSDVQALAVKVGESHGMGVVKDVLDEIGLPKISAAEGEKLVKLYELLKEKQNE